MITEIPDGDILMSEARVIVCPVNTVGVMGKGLAKQMADKWPGLHEAYQAACRRGHLTIDNFFFYTTCWSPTGGTEILCFPTKQEWKFPSQIEWVDEGLKRLSMYCWTKGPVGIESLALPMLGCGEGKLDRGRVRDLIHHHLHNAPCSIELYT